MPALSFPVVRIFPKRNEIRKPLLSMPVWQGETRLWTVRADGCVYAWARDLERMGGQIKGNGHLASATIKEDSINKGGIYGSHVP